MKQRTTKRNKFYLMVLFLLGAILANGQGVVVNGVITDAGDDLSLPSVNVMVKGSTIGVVSDLDGKFSIEVPNANATLVFSYIGYATQEIVLNGQTSLNIALKADIAGLEEVVVIGYGTQKKGDVTSAIATVKSDDFVKGGVRDIGQLIQGKVAGLTIYNTSGDPTANTQIRLRGTNTLGGTGTSPLILIDGVPGDFNAVAPEDIQSIDVLKDGSAAAIYGTRGTNGVIIITTKRATGEYKSKVEYSSYVSTQTISKKMEMLTASDYRQQIADGERDAVYDKGTTTDWMDEITQTPLSQVHSVSFQGGTNQTNYLLSTTYRDLEGIFINTDNEVFNVRADINHKMFNDKLKFNFGVISRNTRNTTNGDGFSFSGYTYRQALIRNPTESVKNEDGTWYEDFTQFYYENPLGHIYESDGRNKSLWNRLNGTVTFTPIQGLTLKGMVSFNKYNQSRGYYETRNHFSTTSNGVNGFASNGATEAIERFVDLTADYSKSIGRSRFTALVGYSYQDLDNWNYWMNNANFQNDLFGYSNIGMAKGIIDNVDNNVRMGGNRRKTNLIGFFGRATYSYDDKYLVMMGLRREAASQLLGSNYSWGSFPSVSVGWRISKESFMKDLTYIISDLKIRAGYGVTGTQPNRLFNSLATLQYQTGEGIPVGDQILYEIAPSRNPNAELRWEEKKETNFGIDYSLLEGKISGSVDYYSRVVDGLLYDLAVPKPPNPVETTFMNAGQLRGSGLELLIQVVPVSTDDFQWKTSFNYSTGKSTLEKLGNEKFDNNIDFLKIGNAGEPIWDPTHYLETNGGEVGNFWGYKVTDVDDEGKWVYSDSIGQSVGYDTMAFVDDNKHVLGNGIPDHFIGWTNTFVYKNFDLTIGLRGAFGFQILNRQRMYYENTSIQYYNRLQSAYDPVFGKTVLNANMPLQYNSYYIEDGDYVKIDNITLGYNFKPNTEHIRSIRVYASALNAFTFTKYKGVDPEVNVVGLQPGNDGRDKYPTTRTFTFGLNVTF